MIALVSTSQKPMQPFIGKLRRRTAVLMRGIPDLQHYLFQMTWDGKLHNVPLHKEPKRVLDVGCGTGIWSIEFGTVPLLGPGDPT